MPNLVELVGGPLCGQCIELLEGVDSFNVPLRPEFMVVEEKAYMRIPSRRESAFTADQIACCPILSGGARNDII